MLLYASVYRVTYKIISIGEGKRGERTYRHILTPCEVVHAQVEPYNQILIFDILAVEKLAEVLLRMCRVANVLHTIGIHFGVVLLGDSEMRLCKLRVFQRPWRLQCSQVNVRPPRHDAIASRLTPNIGLVRIEHNIHGLVVGSPVELLLSLHNGHIHSHLLKDAKFREPRLRLLHSLQLGDLQ
jgi:hypothetical protein